MQGIGYFDCIFSVVIMYCYLVCFMRFFAIKVVTETFV